MSERALDLVPDAAAPKRAAAATDALRVSELVFIGCEVSWSARLSDSALVSALAEHWEDAFSHWSQEGNSIHVGHSALGYCIDLEPGLARFTLQVPELAFAVALRHASELLQALQEGGRKNVRTLATAQLLQAEEGTFEALLQRLEAKLYNRTFAQRLGAAMADMSYLADWVVDGQWFQVSVGALRAHEVPIRVASTRLAQIPEVATFVQITTRSAVGQGGLESHLRRILSLSDSVIRELRA